MDNQAEVELFRRWNQWLRYVLINYVISNSRNDLIHFIIYLSYTSEVFKYIEKSIHAIYTKILPEYEMVNIVIHSNLSMQ